jgi:hypothetical protein
LVCLQYSIKFGKKKEKGRKISGLRLLGQGASDIGRICQKKEKETERKFTEID